MPDSITVLARAKVNLFLRVGAARADGYHDLETVFHSISLADRVTVRRAPDEAMTLCGMPDVPSEKNIAVRAARALLSRAGRSSQGLALELEKAIPVEAGLGGGSADAAAVLVGVNALLGLGMPDELLEELGASLGADVPFCVRGGLADARGIGERLTRHEPLDFHLVVIKPPVAVSTGAAFRALDELRHEPAPRAIAAADSTAALIARARARGVASLGELAANSFESVVLPRHAEVARARDALRQAGAAWALLTGSGSAVYGVFESASTASMAARSLEAALPTFQVLTCRSAPRGAEIL